MRAANGYSSVYSFYTNNLLTNNLQYQTTYVITVLQGISQIVIIQNQHQYHHLKQKYSEISGSNNKRKPCLVFYRSANQVLIFYSRLLNIFNQISLLLLHKLEEIFVSLFICLFTEGVALVRRSKSWLLKVIHCNI